MKERGVQVQERGVWSSIDGTPPLGHKLDTRRGMEPVTEKEGEEDDYEEVQYR